MPETKDTFGEIPNKIFQNKEFGMSWTEILLLVSGFLLGQMLVGAILLVSGLSSMKSSWFAILSYFLIMAAPILVFYFSLLKPKGNKFPLSLSSAPLSVFILSLGIMVGMMMVSEYLVSLIPISGSFFGPIYKSFSEQMENISSSTVSMVITTVVLAPILEEILFRGIILKGLLNKGLKPWKAIAISALVFGIIHGYPWQLVGASLLGLVLGWVYQKTKSLLIPILLHAFNNGIASFLMTKYNSESYSDTFQIPEFILFFLGITLLSIFGFLFYKINFKSNNNS